MKLNLEPLKETLVEYYEKTTGNPEYALVYAFIVGYLHGHLEGGSTVDQIAEDLPHVVEEVSGWYSE